MSDAPERLTTEETLQALGGILWEEEHNAHRLYNFELKAIDAALFYLAELTAERDALKADRDYWKDQVIIRGY